MDITITITITITIAICCPACAFSLVASYKDFGRGGPACIVLTTMTIV